MAGLPVRGIFPTLLLTGLFLSFGQEVMLKEVNLCDRRPGFEPNGEHLDKPGDSLVVYTNWTNKNPRLAYRCLMRFSTCDHCRLQVRANSSFHFHPCRSSTAYKEYDGWCVPGCTYIHLYDKFYSNQTAVTYTSSSSINSGILNFTTQSRFIYVIACANKTNDIDVFFSLNITAEDKTQYFRAQEVGSRYTFTSPLFPVEYVLNSETYKYVFMGDTHNSFITISFDDWQLSQFSSILFDKANIKGKIWGTNNRPWIISDSYRLEMTFDTGPYKIPGTLRSFKGFKATYTFHNAGRDDVPYVHTNCGQWIEWQESGMISFNPKGDGHDYYDCIWVIKRHPNFQHVFIRVVNYSTTDKIYRSREPSLLEIREGLTSKGRLVISAVPSTDPKDKLTFQDYDSRVGYYVRVKGHYWGQRDFALSFTSFNLGACRNMFWCNNGRCISTNGLCNGVDNCGDGSDESYSKCGGPTTPTASSSSNLLSPVIIIPMVVIIFAIIIICLLAIFIRRCRRLSCEARRAQQGQGRISTVSGAVNSRQQRRRNRRRGEHRSERAGDHIHLHHDPPPSYEDVLNATPIGYLNLGFSDQTNSSTGLIQPPSYDEAISPTTHNPAFSFPPGDTQDESSDSSLPDTLRRSRLNLSSSYSSDDTRRARADRHRQRGTVSSSSSDSSNDGEGLRAERGRRGGEGEQRAREEGRQVESCQTAAGQGVVKPEERQIQLPVCSSADLAHNKSSKPQHHKPAAGGQENEEHAPAVISASASTAPGALSGPHSEGPASSSRRVEASPMISAASSEGQGAPTGYPSDQQREVPDPGAVCLFPPASSPQASQPQSAGHLEETPAGPGEARSRHSPNRRIPPHILRARNAPSQTLMKHLSRSLNDLDQQPTEDGYSRPQGFMPPRHLSQSMQNILDSPAERPHRGAEHHQPELNRHHHHHHGSQTLPSQHDALNDTAAAPQGRNGFLPPDGHSRRARSEDFAERNPSRSDPQGHPDSRRGDHVRPGTLQNERPAGNQRSEGPPPAASRPKPQPKPRRLQQPGGNARPEPRQRQSLEGYSYRPSEEGRSPDSDRGRPHNDRNQQARPAHPQGEGAWQARANRPQAPPRPDMSSRAPASSGQARPRASAHGSRERAGFSKESLPPPQGQNVGPPHRHGDPPPYRPRPSSGGPARPPPSLHSPAQLSAARTAHPSEHSRPAEGSFQPGGDRGRQDHPPHFAPTPRATASFPRMGVQAVQSAEGGIQSQGSHTGGPSALSRSASSSSHRVPDREDDVSSASQSSASTGGAPFMTLRMDGEEEDIYV